MTEPLSWTGARWVLHEGSATHVARIERETGLAHTAARCLAGRLDTAQDARGWLAPSLDQLHDPYAMLGMEAAVARLRAALDRRERIRIITDYDVDGTTSSLILQAALRVLQPDAAISYHIPSRFDEGYGFSVRAAEQAAADGIGLVVTADIGVRDHASVAAARDRGVDVLVCDHHLPAGASVPPGALVLCPPQDGCSYPNPSLAACGVSLKLAQALLASHPKLERILRSMLKLAAIGTVADLVPLTTLENRAIVALGLEELNRGPHHAGLRALLDVCRLQGGALGARDLGFRIGPRINAAGRIAEASLVVQLLTSRDESEARELADRLDALNAQRREIQRSLAKRALEQLGPEPPPFVVVAGTEEEGWHRGVVGIVASRVKDEAHRPAAVVSVQGALAVGSVRSIAAVHAVRALDSVADLLLKYGGHPAAAGFTVRTADLDALRARLCDFVVQHADPTELVPTRRVDAVLEASDVDRALLADLRRLGPHGMGNPRPALLVRGVQPRNAVVRGQERSLLKFSILPPGSGWVDAIWWGQAERLEQVQAGPIDVLASLGENVWQGRSTLQLEVRDARDATPRPPAGSAG